MSQRHGDQLTLFPLTPRSPVEPAAVGDDIRQLAERVPRGVYLGTSSWSFPGWAGIVYDQRASSLQLARHGLAAYAQHPLLRGVGIDRTYYSPLSAAELTGYAGVVPPSFRFLVKAHDACTIARFPSHARYGAQRGAPNPLFLDARYATDEVVAPFIEGLGDHGGPLVFQFPPQNRRWMNGATQFADRLYGFLSSLPRGPLYAVEIRDPELLTSAFAAAVSDASAVPCLTVHPAMPDIATQAAQVDWSRAPALVVRWMLARHREYEEARLHYHPFNRVIDDDPATRATLADLCMSAVNAGRRAYVIINNKAEGSAPLSVFRLAETIVATPG